VRPARAALPLLALSLIASGCGATRPVPAVAPSHLTPAWTLQDAPATAQGAGIPEIGAGRVVVSGPSGELATYALATGRLLWEQPVVADPSVLLGPALVLGSRVLIETATSLAAYGLGTGALLWQVPLQGLALAGTQPVPFAGLVVLPGAGLPMYDPSDGRMVRLLAPGVYPHPTSSDLAVQGSDLLVATTEGTIRAYAEGGRLVWEATAPPVAGPSGQPAGVGLVGVDPGSAGVVVAMEGVAFPCQSSCLDNGALEAVGLAAATGRVLWTQAPGDVLPVVAAEGLPVAVETGQGMALSLADGHVAWQWPQQGTYRYASLELVQGRLVAFDAAHGRLLLADPRTGQTLDQQSVPYAASQVATLDARPHLAVGGGYAVVTSSDGHLVAFRIG